MANLLCQWLCSEADEIETFKHRFYHISFPLFCQWLYSEAGEIMEMGSAPHLVAEFKSCLCTACLCVASVADGEVKWDVTKIRTRLPARLQDRTDDIAKIHCVPDPP